MIRLALVYRDAQELAVSASSFDDPQNSSQRPGFRLLCDRKSTFRNAPEAFGSDSLQDRSLHSEIRVRPADCSCDSRSRGARPDDSSIPIRVDGYRFSTPEVMSRPVSHKSSIS